MTSVFTVSSLGTKYHLHYVFDIQCFVQTNNASHVYWWRCVFSTSLKNLHLRRTHEVPQLQTAAEPVAAVTHSMWNFPGRRQVLLIKPRVSVCHLSPPILCHTLTCTVADCRLQLEYLSEVWFGSGKWIGCLRCCLIVPDYIWLVIIWRLISIPSLICWISINEFTHESACNYVFIFNCKLFQNLFSFTWGLEKKCQKSLRFIMIPNVSAYAFAKLDDKPHLYLVYLLSGDELPLHDSCFCCCKCIFLPQATFSNSPCEQMTMSSSSPLWYDDFLLLIVAMVTRANHSCGLTQTCCEENGNIEFQKILYKLSFYAETLSLVLYTDNNKHCAKAKNCLSIFTCGGRLIFLCCYWNRLKSSTTSTQGHHITDQSCFVN